MNEPTPLELMAFADGEVDDVRAEEIADWLEDHPDDAQRVAQMAALGSLVERVEESRVVDVDVDIAGDVMAAIDRLDAATRNGALASLPAVPRVLSSRPPAAAVARPDAAALASRTLARQRSRRATFALGGTILAVAAAAAAALVMFLRAPSPEQTAGPIASMTTLPEIDPAGEERALDPATAVDVVDFGAHQGTIFYVPGASTSTTVVWIADEEGSK